MPGRWAAAVLVAAVGVGPAAGQDLTAEQIRDKVRQAVGYDAWQKLKDGVELSGKSEYWGIPGTFRRRLHPDGRHAHGWTAEGEHGSGFDGKRGWRYMFSDPHNPPQVNDNEPVFVNTVLDHRWLAADTRYAVALHPDEHRSYLPCLTLTHPDATANARLRVDPETWLPRSLVVPVEDREWVTEFDDYRDIRGAKVPARVAHNRFEGGEVFAADHVGVIPAGTTNPFAAPAVEPDATFDPSAPAKVEARRGKDGLLFVRLSVDGRPTPWLMLDSGAQVTALTAAAADRLGVPGLGRLTAFGAGGSVPTRFRLLGPVTFGPMTVRRLVGIDCPAGFAAGLSEDAGFEVGGVAGGDLFARAVVEIDQPDGVVRVHDPAAYRPPVGAGLHPARFRRLTPCLDGTLDGKHAGRFALDTGYSGTVMLTGAAVRRLDLLAGRSGTPSEVVGIAGEEKAVRAAADFTVLGRPAQPIQAQFELSRRGSPYTLGTFGLAALGPGTVVFDYPNRRVAFVPKP